MSITPPEQPLPSIPSAGRLSTQNYFPGTTPAMQRLNVNAPVVGPATGRERYVYMGEVEVDRPAGFPYKDPNKSVKTKVDQLVPIADARYMLYTMAPEARQRLYDTATAYFGSNNWDQSWLDGVWEKAINISANAYAYGNQKVDPVTTFQMIVDDMAKAGTPGGDGKYTGPVTTRQTTTSVNLTDPATARGLVKSALTNYLGRDANEMEQEAFLTALNAAERRSPTVTRSVSTTTPRGKALTEVESETISSGGFNPSTFAEEYAQGQEGAAEFQAATTLMDSFISALRARV